MASVLSSSQQNLDYSQTSDRDNNELHTFAADEGEPVPSIMPSSFENEQTSGDSKHSSSPSMSPALSFLSLNRHAEGNNPILSTPQTPSFTPPHQTIPPSYSQSQVNIPQSDNSHPTSTPPESNDFFSPKQLYHGLSVSVAEADLGHDEPLCTGLVPPGRIGPAASYPCLTTAAISVPSNSNVNKSWSGSIRSSPVLGNEGGYNRQSNASPSLSRLRSHTPDLEENRVPNVYGANGGSRTPSPTENVEPIANNDERFVAEGFSVSPEFLDCQTELDLDNVSRSSESNKSNELQAGRDSGSGKEKDKERKESRGSSDKERSKRKSTWYNALNPTYKSRMEDFKRIFKDLPLEERLIVDYSCALQRDILLQGRIYVTQNFICFYANIFRWETVVQLRWKDVTSLTKEKTALVIPNAIQLTVENNDKYFFTSFGARDKTYVVLFRTWQKALLEKPLTNAELLQFVHSVYGIELGFSSGDDDELLNTGTGATEHDDLIRKSSDVTDSPPLAFKLASAVSIPSGLYATSTLSSEFSHFGYNTVPASSPSTTCLEDNLSRQVYVTSGSGNIMADVSPNGNSQWTEHVVNGFGSSSLDTNRMVHGRKDKLSSKEDANLPTDLSDTTESDDNEEPVQCPEVHDGRQLLNTIVPFSVDQVFTMFFTNASFYDEFQANRKSTDVIISPWQPVGVTGEKRRQLLYTLSLNQSLGVKSCRTTEIQTLLSCSRTGHLYALSAEVTNAGIPYADAFSAVLHYCIIRMGPRESRLVVFAQIKYKKSVWGIVKTFIEKNTWSGLEDYVDQLKRAFLSAVPSRQEERPGTVTRPEREATVKLRHTRPPAQRRRRPNTLGKLDISEANTSFVGTGERSTKGIGLVNYTQQADTSRAAGSMSDYIVKAVMVILVLLIFVIGLLFWRLYTLESFAKETTIPGTSLRLPEAVLKAKPQSEEEWLLVLRHQEALHKLELEKWRQVLAAATDMLKQTEDSLTLLRQDVDVDKASSVIQRLKSLVSTEEEIKLGTRTEKTGATTRSREAEDNVPGGLPASDNGDL